MDRISTIQSQTIANFSKPSYAVAFIVDNNPKAAIAKLSEMGYSSAFKGELLADKLKAKSILINLYNGQQTETIKDFLDSVPYLNDSADSAEYTKGFRAYFLENTPTSAVNTENYSQGSREFSFDGLMAALGSGLTTYTSYGQQTQYDQQYIQAKAEEEAAAKKRTMWIWIGSIVGILAIIGIVIMVKKKKN